MKNPKISIITASYNCGSKLQRTIDSVLNQDFTDFEFLIIDAGSTDSTAEIIKQTKDRRLTFISEPDKGVYDAMNKGIKLAKGEFLFFLGVGDEILPKALTAVQPFLAVKARTSVIYGNVLYKGNQYDGQFSKTKICRRNICHQAMFFQKNVFDQLGNYDLQYKTLADWEFNLRCFGSKKVCLTFIPVTVAYFEEGGMSSGGDLVFERHLNRLIIRHLGIITFLFNFIQKQTESCPKLRAFLRFWKRLVLR